jgi:hypothetical protein
MGNGGEGVEGATHTVEKSDFYREGAWHLTAAA